MVIKKEGKKAGIFDGFHIEEGDHIGSNAQQLEFAENEEKHASSAFVDEGIFSDFDLDGIVKENEEREQRDAAAAALDDNDNNNMYNSSNSDDKNKNNNKNETNTGTNNGKVNRTGSLRSTDSLRSLFSRKGKNDTDDITDQDEGRGDAILSGINEGGSGRKLRLRMLKDTKQTKSSSRSRSGTTVTTIPEENELYHESTEDYYDDDDDIDDTDNIIFTEEGRRRETTPDAGGGGAAAAAASFTSDLDDRFNWISPHSSDSIFSDFDLDAIVKDYEKLQRRIKFRPGTGGGNDYNNNNSGGDNDNADDDANKNNNNAGDGGNNHYEHPMTNMGINVRYRNMKKIWLSNFPRTHGLAFRVFLPLCVLVGCTIVLGIALAEIEMPQEVQENDDVMRAKYEASRYPYDETLNFLFDLPTDCFDFYIRQKQAAEGGGGGERDNTTNAGTLNTSTSDIKENYSSSKSGNDTAAATTTTTATSNITAFKAGLTQYSNSSIVDGGTSLNFLMVWNDNFDFPPVTPGYDDDPTVVINEIKEYLEVCENAGSYFLREFIEQTTAKFEDISSSSLAFNWQRCWNTTELGSVNPFMCSKELSVAAGNQSEFYKEMWTMNQTALYNQYLSEGDCATSLACRKNAHARSVAEATGSTMCGINMGASAWFWFVFLTTVGYGNVSPATQNGKLLVGMIGWILIIIWGMVLYVGGRVVGIIIDDLLQRCRCKYWTESFHGVIIWGIIAGLWMTLVGFGSYFWFNFSYNPTQFEDWEFRDGSSYLSLGDAMWFSYISLLTVGLGDFYLDSEYMFFLDLCAFSIAFLVGFTFLSTFLGQVADFINNFFPDSGDALRERLMNTDLVGRKEVQYKKENEAGIEKLEKLVEMMDDDDLAVVTQRVTRIRVKNYVLSHLLYQTKLEMDYYKKQGELYENLSYNKVCEEENMLNEVLANTVREREKLESYRDGRATTADVSSSSLPSVSHSFLEGGTEADILEKKLQSRKKKYKRVNSPSLHL